MSSQRCAPEGKAFRDRRSVGAASLHEGRLCDLRRLFWYSTAALLALGYGVFDFARELAGFSTRGGAHLALLTNRYASTVEEQSVHLDVDYPDARQDVNRWLPLVKWLLAIPNYIVPAVLIIEVILGVVVAWLANLLTGRYPRPLSGYVVEEGRWPLRVQADAFLLVTDRIHHSFSNLDPAKTSRGGRRGMSKRSHRADY